MAKFSKGITFAANAHYSAANLHALIDTAIAASDAFPGTPALYDIVAADLAAGGRAIHVASSPSTPSTNDLAVGSDGMLDRYTGSAWQDLTTDWMFLINASLNTLVTGTPVVQDPASAANCKLWVTSGVAPEPLGVSMTVCASGATAQIQTRGIAIVRVNSPATVAVDDHLNIGAQGATCLSKTTSVLTDVLGIVIATDTANPTSGNALAVLVH